LTPLCHYAPHELGAQEVSADPEYKPAVHMLLSAMATESSCRFETWPQSRVSHATRRSAPLQTPAGGPAAPDCSALALTVPSPTHSLQARELHRVGQAARRRRLRRVRDAQWEVRCPAFTPR
jgi:hypothetical protein